MASFNEILSNLTEGLFSNIMIFGGAFFAFIALLAVVYYYGIYKRKFNIDVKVISRRAGQMNLIRFDKAAMLVDRTTKAKYFRLWDLRVDLTAPDFNVLQLAAKTDYIEILRTAEDSFYFLTPSQIDSTKVIKADGKEYGIAQQSNKKIDTDMSFWSQKRKSLNKGMFDQETMMMKFLLYLPQIMSGVFMIFILYILLDHLPGILAQLKDLIAEMKSLREMQIYSAILGMII